MIERVPNCETFLFFCGFQLIGLAFLESREISSLLVFWEMLLGPATHWSSNTKCMAFHVFVFCKGTKEVPSHATFTVFLRNLPSPVAIVVRSIQQDFLAKLRAESGESINRIHVTRSQFEIGDYLRHPLVKLPENALPRRAEKQIFVNSLAILRSCKTINFITHFFVAGQPFCFIIV